MSGPSTLTWGIISLMIIRLISSNIWKKGSRTVIDYTAHEIKLSKYNLMQPYDWFNERINLKQTRQDLRLLDDGDITVRTFSWQLLTIYQPIHILIIIIKEKRKIKIINFYNFYIIKYKKYLLKFYFNYKYNVYQYEVSHLIFEFDINYF